MTINEAIERLKVPMEIEKDIIAVGCYNDNPTMKVIAEQNIEAYSMAIEALEQSQWTPCSVKLPERGIEVQVTRDYDGRKDYQRSRKYVETAVCYGEDEDAYWVSFSDEYKTTPESHRVIAWKELPEPYKGGE